MKLSKAALWSDFKTWFKDFHEGEKVPKLAQFTKFLTDELGDPVKTSWGGIRFKTDEDYVFNIEPGETTSTISNKLYDSNLILSSKLFNLYSRLFSLDDNFKAGEYDLNSYESIHSLGEKFSNGDILYRKLTILPGMTLSQILDQGNQVGLINDLFIEDNILDRKESERFLKTVQNLKKLKSGQLDRLNIEVRKSKLKRNSKKGIF